MSLANFSSDFPCLFQEVFRRLPLPYVNEDFKIDVTWKEMESKMEPPPYVHIRRSILHLLICYAEAVTILVKNI